MHNIYKNSVGYHQTNERFDWYCFANYAVIIDTLTNVCITGWINPLEAERIAKELNKLQDKY